MAIKVLVVDDSVVYRRVLSEALRSLPEVEVVGSAANGRQVLPKVQELRPDLVTLDIEMPGLNGIEVMEALRQAGLEVKVLVVSSLTISGGKLTLQALENGAFDFITKPADPNPEENFRCLCRELAPRLRALGHRLEIRKILRADGTSRLWQASREPHPAARETATNSGVTLPRSRPELVVIGVSTGGPNALATIFSALPGDLGVPLLIVQHMPPIFTQLLATNLSAHSALAVREARHNEEIVANTAYIAPGGRHMKLIASVTGARVLQLSDDPAENCCRPSVDYLFRSVANHFPAKALAVILTGMGEDGTAGLRLLKQGGSTVLAQDEASCVVFGMPKAAIEAGVVDCIVPLAVMAERITTLVRGS
ncbi:MAG TPA: chemotaxis response regulator protein-glutamate methylesterase [Terriglobales bacterium]|nr:chemotaxis response regulator protein-glutamate methylesterase [Terriglobales bacterium]